MEYDDCIEVKMANALLKFEKRYNINDNVNIEEENKD